MKDQNRKKFKKRKLRRFAIFCAYIRVNTAGPNSEIPESVMCLKEKVKDWEPGDPIIPHPIKGFRKKMAELEKEKKTEPAGNTIEYPCSDDVLSSRER